MTPALHAHLAHVAVYCAAVLLVLWLSVMVVFAVGVGRAGR